MVSGFVTSPELQARICFEDARPISMASKLLMSIMRLLGLVRLGGDVAEVDVCVCVDVGVLEGLGGLVRRAGVGVVGGLGLLVGRVAVRRAHAAEVDAQLLRR